MATEYGMKDSGQRQAFETGAVRDIQEGKGRYDLLSPLALRRIAIIMEKGAKKYGERNWEKGIPIGRCLDSAKRHLDQYIEGKRDEDHLGQACWNLMAALHIEELVERGVLPSSLNDLPNYQPTAGKTQERGNQEPVAKAQGRPYPDGKKPTFTYTVEVEAPNTGATSSFFDELVKTWEAEAKNSLAQNATQDKAYEEMIKAMEKFEATLPGHILEEVGKVLDDVMKSGFLKAVEYPSAVNTQMDLFRYQQLVKAAIDRGAYIHNGKLVVPGLMVQCNHSINYGGRNLQVPSFNSLSAWVGAR